MKRVDVRRVAPAIRALTAVLLVAGLLLAAARATAAQREDSEAGENSYSGENYDWSVEWDEDDWVFAEDDTTDGTDYLMLENAKGPFAYAVIIVQDDGRDAEACIDFWFESMEQGAGLTDIEVSDDMGTLPLPKDGADAAYTYDAGSGLAAGYAQCRSLEDGSATVLLVMTTTPDVYEDRLELFGGLVSEIEGVEQPAANAGDDDEIEDEDDEAATDSGIDGERYVSPTYGYAIDWSGSAFQTEYGEELVNHLPEGIALDRLLLRPKQGTFYIEGKVEYGGDARDCLNGEVEASSEMDGVEDIVPYAEDGEVVEGRTDGGGRYGAYILVREAGDEGAEWMAYIECRPLVEGESVIVFTLYTTATQFEKELAEARDVIDTLELAEGTSKAGKSASNEGATGVLQADNLVLI